MLNPFQNSMKPDINSIEKGVGLDQLASSTTHEFTTIIEYQIQIRIYFL